MARSPRRPREEEADNTDYTEQAGSRLAKRQRLSNVDNETQESGSETADDSRVEDDEDVDAMANEDSLLPDSYRRSPTYGRPTEDGGTNDTDSTYQPGAIVRIAMKNFVTYTDAGFHPGPNLNMIIGPNGTGKSTVVCAICLGLGWSPALLARAKEPSAFVKHGAKEATITIELAADTRRHRENPVIVCHISRQNDKVKFLINGKESNRKHVQKLVRSYDIQVDNLCQFLPQDRVTEFSALKPVDLLRETLRAAASDQMIGWHEQLKTMHKEERQAQIEQQTSAERLAILDNKQRSQEGEVSRLRERNNLRQRYDAFLKMKPLANYNQAKRIHDEIKDRKLQAQAELDRLQEQIQPSMKAVEDKQRYAERIENTVRHRNRIIERTETETGKVLQKYNKAGQDIAAIDQEIEAERRGSKEAQASLPRYQQELSKLQRAMQSPPAQFDPVEINTQLRAITQRDRDISDQISSCTEELRSLREQHQQRERIIESCQERQQTLQTQEGRQTNKLGVASKDTAKAWQWVQSNANKFVNKVFGPPVVTCTVKNVRHADQVESFVNRAELLAFTTTCEQDFKTLQQHLYRDLRLTDINIRSVIQPLSHFRPPCSDEELQGYGLESWLIDQLEGPDEVLAMLCDNRNLHRTGFTSRNLTPAQSDALTQSNISSWVTLRQINVVTRRREYGAHGSSARVQQIKKAELLTDAPVDVQANNAIQREISEKREEQKSIGVSRVRIEAKKTQLETERAELKDQHTALQEEKNQKQRQQSEFNALPAKCERLESKIAESQSKIAASKRLIMGKVEAADKLCLEKAQLALSYARQLMVLRDLHEQVMEAEIIAIEAASDVSQLEARHVDESRLLQERQREVASLRQQQVAAKTHALEIQRQCMALRELDDFENTIRSEAERWEPSQLETAIDALSAQLESLHGGNVNIIRDYEKRAMEIEKRTMELESLATALEERRAKIAEIQQQWEVKLDSMVGRISAAFSENCTRIQCAGEVVVHKDEDFDAWAIHIRIKFRERDEMSILTSKRQSGGERTVSTIFYLLALQSLARAPFRLVDEINQGMDPRNERLVHSRIVATACSEYSSQYFLITPKLLTGLEYHPKMKVHCIASGEHMPTDHRELDLGFLAQRALDLSIRAAGAVTV